MDQYNKILVINLMHIGDLLLVTPVLKTLRTNYPKAHIALLADAKLRDLVKDNKHIDELIEIDKKGYHNNLLNYFKFIGAIRKKKFDIAINLHANERASFIAALSGAKKVVGYTTVGAGLFFDKVMKNTKAIKHQIHSHFDVLKEAVGVSEIDDGGLEMWLTKDAIASANKLWQANYDKDTFVVGFNIGASWETKRWCDEYYAIVADKLLDQGYGVAFFGGSMDEALVEKTINQMKHKSHDKLKIFTGKLSLQELGAMIKRCSVFLTNDSGPMHIAVALDVPVVTMFGASPVPGFYPYNDKSVLIKTPVKCHPCGIHHCDTLECMKTIGVDVVLEQVLTMLDKYKMSTGAVPRNIGQYQCEIIELH